MKRNSNNSHFIYADRKIIEEGVNENMSISQIAYNMKRNKSSILREIDRNKTYIFPSTFNNSHPCIKHKNCPVKEFNCFENCKNIEINLCPKLISSPHICNACRTKSGCRYVKIYYKAYEANNKYLNAWSNDRTGLRYSEDELIVLNTDFYILVINTRSIYHSLLVINNRGYNFKEKSIYRQIKDDQLRVKSKDLPRNRKAKKKQVDTEYKNKESIEGHMYDDYEKYKKENKDAIETQMDTVIGIINANDPVILTLEIVEISFMFIFKLNRKTFEETLKKLQEFENYIYQKKVAIIGLGVSNIPLLDYLYEKKANVTVFDDRTIDELPGEIVSKLTSHGIPYFLGKDNLKNLNGFNLIFRSPSCLPTRPELRAEEEKGAIVTTEIEMLMKMCPCKIIGVTGSEGKTTTTSLIYAILKHAGYNTYLGGNIGTPLFTKLSEILPDDIVVLELSSFQLMEMEVSPNISVITNITPNHLNIHSSYEEYIEAKKTIFKYQTQDDTLILNYDNEITRKCKPEANSKVIYFSSKEKLNDGYIVDGNIIKECENKLRKHILNTKEIKLRGTHNFENICAALAATRELVDEKTAVEAIKEFNSVEHRLEFVREINGVKWYNDSASSSPSRTIAGLNAYDEEIVLIAGGYDKNLDYDILGKYIVKKVKALVLIGNTAKKILDATTKEMEKQGVELPICFCQTLEDAVKAAKQVAKENQVVLFSPASASFDMFKNFADRGNQFKKLVNEL